MSKQAVNNNSEWKNKKRGQPKTKPRKMRQRHHEFQEAKDGTYWFQATPTSTKIELPPSLVNAGKRAFKRIENALPR